MNIGFIPLRKGSKGIPSKNRKFLLGRPLFSWALTEAENSVLDLVYVFTDDQYIKDYIINEYVDSEKIKVLARSEESATDSASTEFAMIEFIKLTNIDYDTISLIQATSPLVTKIDINNCIQAINDGFESALTVTPIKRFFWNKNNEPINYDYNKRPRRQDVDFEYTENGACYTTTKKAFTDSKNRISGKIKLIKMSEESFYEIDEQHDFKIVEALLINRLKKNHFNSFDDIKLLCLDVDGVLTDGTSQYTSDGELSKNFSLFDGKGLELLRSKGIDVCIITSENSKIVKARVKKLKIESAFYGIKDKYRILEKILNHKQIKWSQVAYIGDDVNDLTNIIASGVSFCPKNGNINVKFYSSFLLRNFGGNGAVREACDIILKNLSY